MASDLVSGDLQARDVSVVRGARRTLSGASITITRGALTTLRGASGSGKSTLLRVLAALEPFQEGALFMGDTDVASLSPQAYRRAVALVPQRAVMVPGTVADNVALGPALRGTQLSAGGVAALLERVGLSSELLRRDACGLSGGEQQRVALARALANEPEMLLVDEPTAALDHGAAAHVLALLRRCADEGLGTLLVTHGAPAVSEDAAYVCHEGRVEKVA